MILIPAFWLTSLRITAFLTLGLADLLAYLYFLDSYLKRVMGAKECDKGQSLKFVIIQLPLLFSLFLFLLVDLLLRYGFYGK